MEGAGRSNWFINRIRAAYLTTNDIKLLMTIYFNCLNNSYKGLDYFDQICWKY